MKTVNIQRNEGPNVTDALPERETVARAIYGVTVRWVQPNFPKDHKLKTFDEIDDHERRLNMEYADAALAAANGGWQPIETAPLSPEWNSPPTVLLWVADGGSKGSGCHAFGRVHRYPDGDVRAVASGFSGNWRITHWMPLPEPPK